MKILITLFIISIVTLSLFAQVPNSPTSKEVKVEKNETLETIANEYGVDVIKLADYNQIPTQNITKILPRGMKIIIPRSLINNYSGNDTGESLQNNPTPQNRQADEQIKILMNKAGMNFKEGLTALLEGRRKLARDNFDKSVEVFLMSGINLNSKNNVQARDCYNQLIETIYRIEFPTKQFQPQLRQLFDVCKWIIDEQFLESISSFILKNSSSQVISDEELQAEINFNKARNDFEVAQTELISVINTLNKRFDQENNYKTLKDYKDLQNKYVTTHEMYIRAKQKFDEAFNLYSISQAKLFSFASKRGNIMFSTDFLNGFVEQRFNPSRVDDLATLELTQEETNVDTPQQRPRYLEYKRPTTPVQTQTMTTVITVKTKAGDTVAKLAARYGVSAVDIANQNGLTSINAPLQAGREIKIPTGSTNSSPQKSNQAKLPNQNSNADSANIGDKPIQRKDGKVPVVMDYFNEYFNDPYSMRFVRWSPIEKKTYLGTTYWAVQVKFRAKNSFGAYILSEMIFYIQKNKVVITQKLY